MLLGIKDWLGFRQTRWLWLLASTFVYFVALGGFLTPISQVYASNCTFSLAWGANDLATRNFSSVNDILTLLMSYNGTAPPSSWFWSITATITAVLGALDASTLPRSTCDVAMQIAAESLAPLSYVFAVQNVTCAYVVDAPLPPPPPPPPSPSSQIPYALAPPPLPQSAEIPMCSSPSSSSSLGRLPDSVVALSVGTLRLFPALEPSSALPTVPLHLAAAAAAVTPSWGRFGLCVAAPWGLGGSTALVTVQIPAAAAAAAAPTDSTDPAADGCVAIATRVVQSLTAAAIAASSENGTSSMLSDLSSHLKPSESDIMRAAQKAAEQIQQQQQSASSNGGNQQSTSSSSSSSSSGASAAGGVGVAVIAGSAAGGGLALLGLAAATSVAVVRHLRERNTKTVAEQLPFKWLHQPRQQQQQQATDTMQPTTGPPPPEGPPGPLESTPPPPLPAGVGSIPSDPPSAAPPPDESPDEQLLTQVVRLTAPPPTDSEEALLLPQPPSHLHQQQQKRQQQQPAVLKTSPQPPSLGMDPWGALPNQLPDASPRQPLLPPPPPPPQQQQAVAPGLVSAAASADRTEPPAAAAAPKEARSYRWLREKMQRRMDAAAAAAAAVASADAPPPPPLPPSSLLRPGQVQEYHQQQPPLESQPSRWSGLMQHQEEQEELWQRQKGSWERSFKDIGGGGGINKDISGGGGGGGGNSGGGGGDISMASQRRRPFEDPAYGGGMP
ncbi:hypothetical protein VOLCADRAFT_95693 [Volvox carteri f. nagariensis]|uniref:Uncharacterized protein n=1 Tax=Volvox carteri f. nagariensis TaxID=3068 RepID=D8U851_VOLCA|nr:uncharacterized protein VOLCADRAFT_95693 [Volvox carteri f. nagariensis]EFJ44028.1 hypothetical protein VOLCADRAFT_95693 [Volvox carteri f. nagariensis]|eukprot:XP_002954829.1 hypothetical protein VOLCADRAFT_95693 [Volvox carteri f. nagariensis]